MRAHRLLLLLGLLAATACADAIAPEPEFAAVDDALLAQLAEEAAEATEARLPSLDALVRASRRAIRASDGGHEEALRYFRRARALAAAAEDSAEVGAQDAADRMAHRGYLLTLHGVVATLGDGVAAEALDGSAGVLARVEARLEGREVPERLANRIAAIGEVIAVGRASLAGGDAVAALHGALRAADGIRHLSPSYHARHWLAQAATLLREATAATGDSVTEEEAGTLRRARRLLHVARDAYEAGEWGRAAEAAVRSARLSASVLQGRG